MKILYIEEPGIIRATGMFYCFKQSGFLNLWFLDCFVQTDNKKSTDPLVVSAVTPLQGSRVELLQWDTSRGRDEVSTLPANPVFLFVFPPVRSWMRSQSMGSKFISYLTPTLMRTRSSRNRLES